MGRGQVVPAGPASLSTVHMAQVMRLGGMSKVMSLVSETIALWPGRRCLAGQGGFAWIGAEPRNAQDRCPTDPSPF